MLNTGHREVSSAASCSPLQKAFSGCWAPRAHPPGLLQAASGKARLCHRNLGPAHPGTGLKNREDSEEETTSPPPPFQAQLLNLKAPPHCLFSSCLVPPNFLRATANSLRSPCRGRHIPKTWEAAGSGEREWNMLFLEHTISEFPTIAESTKGRVRCLQTSHPQQGAWLLRIPRLSSYCSDLLVLS